MCVSADGTVGDLSVVAAKALGTDLEGGVIKENGRIACSLVVLTLSGRELKDFSGGGGADDIESNFPEPLCR